MEVIVHAVTQKLVREARLRDEPKTRLSRMRLMYL